jgi:hypothetical protein
LSIDLGPAATETEPPSLTGAALQLAPALPYVIDRQRALCRARTGVCRINAHPAELRAWTRRDVQSTRRDMERRRPASAQWAEADTAPLCWFLEALATFPKRAVALAARVLIIERWMEPSRDARKEGTL